jgi:CDP-2,3-bis-(O-geranylgeranyl)-sn-glycerol synthase
MFFANLLQIFVIFLPAFIANAVPVVAKNIPYIRQFSRPIHAKLLGANKTVRGLLTGIIAGMLTGFLLYLCRGFLILFLPMYSDYFNLYSGWFVSMVIGGWLGLGALVGDIVKSFWKRRLGIKPGTMFQPWDGIDYMVGAIIFMIPFYFAGIAGSIFLLIIGPLLSLGANTIAYHIGWKECWY